MPERVEELLKAQQVPYRTVPHRDVPTSQEVARATHIPGWKVAKVVALRNTQGGWILAVVPAPLSVDLEAMAFWTHLHGLRLATENEIAARFPGCELGAVPPPFEQLHDAPVYIDDSFARTHDLYFEDGSHRRLIGMRVQDFVRVADPTIRHFASRSARGH
jgi:Ala-tRNA(Pro) deacylase